MAIKLSLSFWLAVLAMATQIQGETWPLILTDVGNYGDDNTAPLTADLNNGVNPDTTGPNGWTASSHSGRIEQTKHGGRFEGQRGQFEYSRLV